MSELLSIWNNTQLTATSPPPPFSIPNSPNAKTIKINNQSRHWILIFKTNTNINVDRIEPFSYLTLPFERDISLKIDNSSDIVESSLQADKEFVDYSTLDTGGIVFSKGSTQFSGSSTVTLSGSVTISNTSLNVAIQGIPTFNIGAQNTVSINGTPTVNINTMPSVTIANPSINVSLAGTNSVNIGNMPSVTIASGTINSTPSSDSIQDVSGSIGSANISQQLFIQSTSNRRYVFFQNISDTDMWINWNSPAIVNNAGSILIPANGGKIVYEGSFIPKDALYAICTVANKMYTLKWG